MKRAIVLVMSTILVISLSSCFSDGKAKNVTNTSKLFTVNNMSNPVNFLGGKGELRGISYSDFQLFEDDKYIYYDGNRLNKCKGTELKSICDNEGCKHSEQFSDCLINRYFNGSRGLLIPSVNNCYYVQGNELNAISVTGEVTKIYNFENNPFEINLSNSYITYARDLTESKLLVVSGIDAFVFDKKEAKPIYHFISRGINSYIEIHGTEIFYYAKDMKLRIFDYETGADKSVLLNNTDMEDRTVAYYCVTEKYVFYMNQFNQYCRLNRVTGEKTLFDFQVNSNIYEHDGKLISSVVEKGIHKGVYIYDYDGKNKRYVSNIAVEEQSFYSKGKLMVVEKFIINKEELAKYSPILVDGKLVENPECPPAIIDTYLSIADVNTYATGKFKVV